MDEDRYVELELKGSTDQALGFVEGLRIGTPEVEKVWYSCRESIEGHGLIEALWAHVGKETRVILPSALAAMVREALTESVLDLEAGDLQPIDYGELEFSYHVYSRDEAAGIRKLVEADLPPGIRLEDYDVNETVDPSGRGVELYSPVHDYECRASGRYIGPVAGIFSLAHRLSDQSFIEPGRVRLHHPSP